MARGGRRRRWRRRRKQGRYGVKRLEAVASGGAGRSGGEGGVRSGRGGGGSPAMEREGERSGWAAWERRMGGGSRTTGQFKPRREGEADRA